MRAWTGLSRSTPRTCVPSACSRYPQNCLGPRARRSHPRQARRRTGHEDPPRDRQHVPATGLHLSTGQAGGPRAPARAHDPGAFPLGGPATPPRLRGGRPARSPGPTGTAQLSVHPPRLSTRTWPDWTLEAVLNRLACSTGEPDRHRDPPLRTRPTRRALRVDVKNVGRHRAMATTPWSARAAPTKG